MTGKACGVASARTPRRRTTRVARPDRWSSRRPLARPLPGSISRMTSRRALALQRHPHRPFERNQTNRFAWRDRRTRRRQRLRPRSQANLNVRRKESSRPGSGLERGQFALAAQSSKISHRQYAQHGLSDCAVEYVMARVSRHVSNASTVRRTAASATACSAAAYAEFACCARTARAPTPIATSTQGRPRLALVRAMLASGRRAGRLVRVAGGRGLIDAELDPAVSRDQHQRDCSDPECVRGRSVVLDSSRSVQPNTTSSNNATAPMPSHSNRYRSRLPNNPRTTYRPISANSRKLERPIRRPLDSVTPGQVDERRRRTRSAMHGRRRTGGSRPAPVLRPWRRRHPRRAGRSVQQRRRRCP